jgi:hypothetical protein
MLLPHIYRVPRIAPRFCVSRVFAMFQQFIHTTFTTTLLSASRSAQLAIKVESRLVQWCPHRCADSPLLLLNVAFFSKWAGCSSLSRSFNFAVSLSFTSPVSGHGRFHALRLRRGCGCTSSLLRPCQTPHVASCRLVDLHYC